MNWVTLLIPLIVLVVWILSNLSRQQEPPKRGGTRTRQPIPGQRPAAPEKPRRSADEVDRFLASLRQKRQEEESSQQQRTQPPPIPSRRPTPVPPPIPTRRPTPAPPPSVEKVIPILTPTPEPTRSAGLRSTVADLSHLQSLPALPNLGAIALSSTPKGKRSKAAEKLVAMLRDRESLQAALLMSEVFSPPLANRRSSLGRRQG